MLLQVCDFATLRRLSTKHNSEASKFQAAGTKHGERGVSQRRFRSFTKGHSLNDGPISGTLRGGKGGTYLPRDTANNKIGV